MTNINLILRDKTSKKPQTIWAVFFINKVRIRVDTHQTIIPKDWSKDKQKALTSHKDYDKVNKLLGDQKDFIEKYLENLKFKKKLFWEDEFKNDFNRHFKVGVIKPKENEVTDFISFIDKWIDSRKDLAPESITTLELTKKYILVCFGLCPEKQINQWNNMSIRDRKLHPDLLQQNKPMDFDDVNFDWMDKFNTWLYNATYTSKKSGVVINIKYKKNYIAKNISIAKRFCTAALYKGLIKDYTFKGVKAGWEDADTVHCDWTEIERLKALDLKEGGTDCKIRDLFVFNSYLGLRLSDLSKLDQDRFTTKNNQLYLKIRLQKTDELVNFPVLKSAEDILKKYNYQLPEIIEQTYNEGIKELAHQADIVQVETIRETRGGIKSTHKIKKCYLISSHTGRRSFATNFTEDGAPINELMLVTGHTTEKSFRKYVKKKAGSEFKGFLEVGANR